eukprot:TRINITY_DN3487_c0_g1_i1.p1 TRINITY_DN3487_c0_g1~~TRINITY_DN3487_c0_g1_i1.p1  ORF type:complete len:329 (+),score=79.70 TRINITY_DN3487_c0_g1_i1:124-1110(+)
MSDDKQPSFTRAVTMSTIYIIVGPSLIVLNKHILHDLGFGYPVTLSSLGQVFIALAVWMLVKTGHASISPEAWEQVSGNGWISCFLVGLFKALTLSFGNAVYLHLNMGYIQMLKAFSPVLMLFLLVVTGVEGRPKLSVVLSVLAIAFFTAATTAAEAHATPMGLFLMAMAQGTEGLALVLTQFLLKKKKMTIIESQCFLAPPSVLCLFAFAAFGGEWKTMSNMGHVGIIVRYYDRFLAAAVFGLAVNYLTFAVIQATSGTMLKVLGTLRNVIVVIVGATVYNESVPANEWLCYIGMLLGFASYTYFSMQPVSPSPKSEKTDQPSKIAG